MKVLSIDVGIKNLAFCLLERKPDSSHFHILKWNSIDVSEQETFTCCELVNKTLCCKPAKFMKQSKYFCLKHSKKQEYQIPGSELNTNFIQKQKIGKLYELADKYNIKYSLPIKKQELVMLFNQYIHETCFESISKKNASKTDLITIGKNIKIKFDDIFSDTSDIDVVIIENQISPIANRMKTIQGMIAQYFIMQNINQEIEFVSAANKLKNISMDGHSQENSEGKNSEGKNSEGNKYSDRKKKGVAKCLELLTSGIYVEWEDYFKKHSKKDDLADSFLQGLWFIANKLVK